MSEDSTPGEEGLKQRKWFNISLFSLTALAILLILYWFWVWHHHVYTNDAYVQGNRVNITALRDGFVDDIYTDDSFLVKKGQLLVQLNETDSRIALDRTKKFLAQTVREVCQAFHQVFILEAEIERRQALYTKAKQNYKHRYDVIGAKGVSLEDYQNAVDDLQAAYAALKSAKADYERAVALVQNTTIINHPKVQLAAQNVRDAWVHLYRSRIYAPVEGLVAQRTIQVGMTVKTKQPLMSIIPLDQIWVNANYKETQVKRMRIGQSVELTSDLYGDSVVFKGRIVGLPGGAGNAFSLLPPENLSGNWIKIVQRLPVRIALEPEMLRRYPLRLGLSMEATTNLRDQTGPMVPSKSNLAPNYRTDIFRKEEEGVATLIEKIIAHNLDPSLRDFALNPLLPTQVAIAKEPKV